MTTFPQRLLVVGLALTSTACASAPAASPSAAAASTPAAGTVPSMVATLSPVSSPVTGLVRLTPTNRADQVRATIDIRGADIGAQLPWQIRQGRCDEDGPELGPLAAYRPLSVRADGTADARVTLPIAMPASGVYHVRVLMSRTQLDRPIACGVLSPEG